MAIIDKIQLSGTVYTIGNETTTAVTSASTDNEIPTAKAVYDAIPQGGGGESCTVDSTTIFYTFNDRYLNDSLDIMARYVVLDYGQHKTEMPDTSVEVYFRDINYNTYVSQNINLNYSTSSYTLGDISQEEYIDVTYDSTIEDFKIAVSTAYTSTVFVNYITFWNGKIKVPFYTISSGSPCTVIENDIPTAISELSDSMLKGLKEISISSQQDAISIYAEKFGGNNYSGKIKLDEIDGSSSRLKPDIYVGLGTSGWTEINLSDQCNIFSLKATKYRVTYNDSELDSYSMGLQFIVEYAGNEINSHVTFDETKQPSLQTQDVFSAATLDWNASTRELVITYPETIELYGKQESVNISQIYSNGCNFGNAITKLESYGEAKQALKSYVKETRAALGGKQDTLVSGTNIKTINGETLLGEGNITIQGGGGKEIEAGTNISITTGETADTINCKLPYYIDSGACWTIFGDSRYGSNKSTNASSSAYIGFNNEIKNTSTSYNTYDNIIIGWGNKLDSYYDSFGVGYNVIIGEHNTLSGSNNFKQSYVIGRYNKGYASDEFICGWSNESRNHYETSFGIYNNSVSASTTFGDSGNTLFSVGNGTSNSERHNAFEIRQNGDIYITKDGQDVKLQDQLGGGGGTSYTAGDGIDITNDVISVTGKVDTSTYEAYTAATDTALMEKANTATTYTKTEVIKQITAITNPINSTLTAHTADTVIHVTSDEKAAWNNKQDVLVSGTNIKTINNQSILGEGNIEIQCGGSVNVVQTTGTSTADVMSQDAITNALRKTNLVSTSYSSGHLDLECKDPFNTSYRTMLKFGMINGMTVANIGSERPSFSLVETSAITTSVTSSSTDGQVPSAKAVNDKLGGLSILKLTQSEYDSLSTKNNSTLYVIVN